MPGPIRPSEVLSARKEAIPEVVFQVFNELIAENLSGQRAVVKQEVVVGRLLGRLYPISRADLFARRWLDVESFYRDAGWAVSYDKPGYNEDYEATFMFTARNELGASRVGASVHPACIGVPVHPSCIGVLVHPEHAVCPRCDKERA